MKYAVIAAFTMFSTASVAMDCQLPSSDPDGDGWGWENNGSCRMPVVVDNGSALSQCLAEGNELEAEIVLLRQRITQLEGNGNSSSGGVNCVDTAPFGNGWGWNGTASCRVGGVDYSSQTPSCQVAANRIEASVNVGMTPSEVQRVVGRPTNVNNFSSINTIIYEWYRHRIEFKNGSVTSFTTYRILCD